MTEKTESTRKPGTGSLAKHVSAKAQRTAAGNYMRAEYARSRGHRSYILKAMRNNRFYLGDGEQWSPEAKAELEITNRRPIEDNQIMPMVNTAIGYQIANRMDIAVRPRGRGADDALATAIGKAIKYVADSTKLHWQETQVFTDGMIQQRGYYDIRMSFEKNALGNVLITTPDPIDVIPDPDAKSYDPEDWADVTTDRWYTLGQIEMLWGKAARKAMETYGAPDTAVYLNSASDGLPRDSFGTENAGPPAYYSELGTDVSHLYHVVDRQYRVYEMTECVVYPTGEIEDVSMATEVQKAAYAEQGCQFVKRLHKRVKWCVSSRDVLLFDGYSPYPWFTIVPFFPFFRRGQTRGMVDNAISPQETLNKALQQMGHILNTVANSGYMVEQNSLANMKVHEFEQKAAQNGLVIVYKKGSSKPERIEPSTVPTGIVEFIAQAKASLVSSTGIDEALTSSGPMNEMSGAAYQARQYAAQQKLAVPLDNLGRTRHMLAERILDLIQMFYDTPRMVRITEQDQFGNDITKEVELNQPVEMEDGRVEYLNDMTIGDYDLVISEAPMQVTFDNSNFEQVKSLATDFGYRVPAWLAIRNMNLTDKVEVAKAIEEQNQQQADPVAEAKAALAKAQALKLEVDTVNTRIESIYSATQAAAQIATIPQTASLADEILQSSGFADQNAAPIIPEVAGMLPTQGAGLAQAAPAEPLIDGDAALAPTNTNPLTPANPGVGINEGIEAPGVQ